MRGDDRVLELLNEVLTAELTAINQYFLHAKMMDDWGYQRLAAHTRHESIDEMHHAEALVERILFLDGFPNLQKLFPLRIGESVQEQLQADLDLEYAAVERLKRGIALCNEAADHNSRELLEHILESEEEHIDWLETQLSAIGDIGIEHYLAQHLHGDD